MSDPTTPALPEWAEVSPNGTLWVKCEGGSFSPMLEIGRKYIAADLDRISEATRIRAAQLRLNALYGSKKGE